MDNLSKKDIYIIGVIAWAVAIVVNVIISISDISDNSMVLLLGGIILQLTGAYFYKKTVDEENGVKKPTEDMVSLSEPDSIRDQLNLIERAKDYITDNPDSGLDLFQAINFLINQDKKQKS